MGEAAAADWRHDRFDAARTAASPEDLPAMLAIRWSLDLPSPLPAWPDQERLRFDAVYRPLVVRGKVIVASSRDDSVAAYDLADGRELWRMFGEGPFRLPPASDGVRVFAGSDDGWLYALDVDSGKLLWKFKAAPRSRPILGNGRLIDTWCIRGGPAVVDGNVYVAAGIWPFMGIFIHCLDAGTGKPVWSNSGEGATCTIQPHGAPSFGAIAPQGALVVAGDRLLVPGGRSLPACYDRRTGKLLHFLLATRTGGHEVVASGEHYFCDGVGYDLSGGKAVGWTPRDPVSSNGELYGLTGGAVAVMDEGELLSTVYAPYGPRKPVLNVDARVETHGATVAIKAGRRLYVGGKGHVSAFDLPLENGQTPAWQSQVEGTVGSMAAASGCLLIATEEGPIHCYCGSRENAKAAGSGAMPASPRDLSAPVLPQCDIDRAKAILNESGIEAGFAVVVGADNVNLARALAAQSRLHVVLLEPNVDKVRLLRKALHSEGLYGERIVVRTGGPAAATLPPYFASLVVAEKPIDWSEDPAWCERVFGWLHPYHGTACLTLSGRQRRELERFAAGNTPGKASLVDVRGLTCLRRSDGLPGAGNWTHEHADAANTRVSRDTLAKAPLGLLWFGGSSHEGVLPRHGHGPQPQVLDGRLIIERVEGLRAMDIYTGRVLWEAAVAGLGSYYDKVTHQPGANATGTNYISHPDAIYVRYLNQCLRLDPATGKRGEAILLPAALADGPAAIWGYLNIIDDYLIGGAATPAPGSILVVANHSAASGDDAEDETEPPAVQIKPSREVPQAVESRSLFVLERKTGKLLWSAAAKYAFRHNAVCAGGGRLYAIDRPPRQVRPPSEPDAPPPPPSRLTTFDLATGRLLWCKEEGVFGTWLSYSAEGDVLIEAGLYGADSLRDEARGMRAYRARDGEELWHSPHAAGPPLLRGNWVIDVHQHDACGLLDGKPVVVRDPLTGVLQPWRWTRSYGCNTPAASQHLLTFRSGAAGYYDLARLGGTGNWGGFRSSCTNNLVIAGGLVTAPDYTRTCTCSYQNQTSLALYPDPDAEMWTYQGAASPGGAPIRRLGVNFGAPGNRLDDNGTLWLEYPKATGMAPRGARYPDVQADGDAAQPEFFRRHSSVVAGPMAWVCSSGMIGARRVSVNLIPPARTAIDAVPGASRRYTVRLYFAEPEGLAPRDRVFSVSLQGREVLAALDVVAESGGPQRSLIKEFQGIVVDGQLVLAMKPLGPRPTLLCGLEIAEEGVAKSQSNAQAPDLRSTASSIFIDAEIIVNPSAGDAE
jgi:outer membrane protein assembly factor BamB